MSAPLLTVCLVGLCVGLTRPITAQHAHPGLHEASTNFDLEDVAPFLKRVVALIDSGFTVADAQRVAVQIGKQAVDSTREYRFNVRAGGVRTPLQIVAFMDDVDAPDIYFFTSKALAERIDAAMAKYMEEVGK
jgi:hypothetical protein